MATSSASPNYNTTTDDEFCELETALRRQIKDTLAGVTTSYERLDSRVQTVEQRLPKNLRFRLKTVEDYVEDHVKCQEAKNTGHPDNRSAASTLESTALSAKVKLLEANVNTILSTTLSAIQLQVDHNKRELERLSKQSSGRYIAREALRVEGAVSLWSNDEVAEEMVRRLVRGTEGPITPALAARLHQLTAPERTQTTKPAGADKPSSSSASHETTSKSRSSGKRSALPAAPPSSTSTLSKLSNIEDPTCEEPAPKRTKSTSGAASRTSSRKITSIWKPAKSNSAAAAAAAVAENKGSQVSGMTDHELTPKELELLLQDEPRRSGRAPKPLARNPEYLTWQEVAAAGRDKSCR